MFPRWQKNIHFINRVKILGKGMAEQKVKDQGLNIL